MNTNISRIFISISIIIFIFGCSTSTDSNNPTDDSNDNNDPNDLPIESAIEFEKQFQTNDSTFVFNSIVQLADSSYTLAGKIVLPALSEFSKNVIVKFDKYGNREWTKVMQSSFTPNGIRKLFLNNDGYIGLRGNDYGSVENNAHIIYYDGNGNVEDEFIIDPNLSFSYLDMIRDGDNFLFAGNSEGQITYRMHNSNGEILWETQQFYNAQAFSVAKLTDGNFVGVGGANFTANDDYLIKFDDASNIIWTKNHKGSKVFSLSDNDFLAIINGDNLARFDQDGEIVWSRTLENFDGINSASPASNIMAYDNGLIVCTYINLNRDLNILVINTEGNLINSKTINKNGISVFTAVSKTIDNGMLLATSDDFKFELIKLSSEDIFD